MTDTLTLLTTGRSNTTMGRWPYLGNLITTPTAVARFDDPAIASKLDGSMVATVYAEACESLHPVATLDPKCGR